MKSKNNKKNDVTTYLEVPLEVDYYSQKHDVIEEVKEEIRSDKPIEKIASVACNGKQFVVRIPTEI